MHFVPPSADEPQKLRLLSFNIQAGTSTSRYHHYVTHSWRQILPHSRRTENLDAISDLVARYDMVALQEADSGSLRSGFINQSRYLATHAGMPFWCHQSNRRVGTVAYAGNGFLSRFEPDSVDEFRLPGAIPGRGSLVIRFGAGEDALVVAVVHLALGKRARRQQLEFLTRQFDGHSNLVVMGDLNAQTHSREISAFCAALYLEAPTRSLASYPSWQPQRAIDHILLSRSLPSASAAVLDVDYSDHCPVEVEVALPADVRLRPALRPVVSVRARAGGDEDD
ncbi:endonuclease/exonuclease/phosphatase family protein [Elongatibacter sediminis]|uniref:Endonuclease/exonuclease/phosphatase family protein n=1 Tax=Elongatibacter sediminis TaxID=3119006 RepID=A0AAW9RML3_9GAMM